MRELAAILDDLYVGRESVTRDEIYRRALVLEASAEITMALDALPEGEYRQDEVVEALSLGVPGAGTGIPADQLTTPDLLRELGELHRTRHETFRHGSDQALVTHSERTAELEAEYLQRFPEREIDPERLRAGARARVREATTGGAASGGVTAGAAGARVTYRTGAEQPWDPEDLAMAEGRDPTPENVAYARRELAERGPAAIERTVP